MRRTGLANSALGWEPLVPLREGLKPTIAYFEQLLQRLGSPQNRRTQ